MSASDYTLGLWEDSMRKFHLLAALLVVLIGIGGTAVYAAGFRDLRERLTGYEEVPAISTTGNGLFRARINSDANEISYTLQYDELQGNVLQSHIHLGQEGVNGGISVFLCSNLGNGPAGTQACPAPPATISGTIRPSDVIGPAGQGIAAGEFDELVRAIRAGATYVNVHSSIWPGGEIRSQLNHDHSDDNGDDDDD
jgi:hypothetical protein